MENYGELNQNENFLKPKRHYPKMLYFCGSILAIMLVGYYVVSAPNNFPSGKIFEVSSGDTLRSVSLHLKSQGIIRSRLLFESFVILYGGDRHIIRADYLFEQKLNVYEVARRISSGDRHISKISVTIPEGFNNNEIALTATSKLPSFDPKVFLEKAKVKQGYLFPDTYFFFSTDGENEVFQNMSQTFEKKIAPLRAQISASGKSEKDIINMAALLEKEARGDGDRNIISGILWQRIKIGMPLQADAARETYEHKGLPALPIGNPGLEAIDAAMHPKSSSYLYYLHDKLGVAHYARTLSEHNQNINKYLR
ncbi:MAG: endolytic transglycosylase MltG [Candidatus Pacebacteria bacterium]|nr:endolytic transglycosylase MltG [Candidatus Paceibacterota bacterium]